MSIAMIFVADIKSLVKSAILAKRQPCGKFTRPCLPIIILGSTFQISAYFSDLSVGSIALCPHTVKVSHWQFGGRLAVEG